MIYKFSFCLVLISINISCLFSQQLPQFTLYQNIPLVYNPSSISITNQTTINLGARWQMLGFGNEPVSSFTAFKMKLKGPKQYNPSLRVSRKMIESENNKFLGHYVGGYFLVDQYGAFRNTILSGIYSTGFQFHTDYKITGGIRLGFSNSSFLKNKATVLNVDDPLLTYMGGDNTYDSYLQDQNNQFAIDFSLGASLVYYNLAVGLSANQITKDYLSFGSTPVNFERKIHFNAFASYLFPVSSISDLQFAVLLKQVYPSQFSFETSMSIYYSDNWFSGINYRHGHAVGFYSGYSFINGLSVSYALDLPVNRMNMYSQGGHEFLIGYTIGDNLRPVRYPPNDFL